MADNYNFTTTQLRQKALYNNDHIVELQIIKTALNKLPRSTYTEENIKILIEFFNSKHNIKVIFATKNARKGKLVGQFLAGGDAGADGEVAEVMNYIRNHWIYLRDERLDDFLTFKAKMDSVLGIINN